MQISAPLRNSALVIFGLACGGGFFALALRGVDIADLGRAFGRLDPRTMTVACGLYWLAIGARALRWRIVIGQIRVVPLAAITETLIVGYAVNNLLPARLGEVFRADYAKRRFGMTRATVLGSIVVERLLDLCAVLACLAGGLAVLEWVERSGRLPMFEIIAVNAALLITAVSTVLGLVRAGAWRWLPGAVLIRRMLEDLRQGIATLNRRSLVAAVSVSALVWLLETAALYTTFRALGVRLEVGEAVLIMGAASLSTLVPTAPGYLGTYQLVFALAMGVFGLPAVDGVAAATTIQIVLFGSVTLAGLGLLTRRWGAGFR